MKSQSVLIGALIALLCGLLLALYVAAAQQIDLFSTREETVLGSSRVTQSLAVVATTAVILVFTSLVIVGVEDFSARRTFSPLFSPLITAFGSIAVTFSLISVSSLDRLLHGDTTWMWAFDPEVRLLLSLGIVGIALGMAWTMFVIYRGRTGGR